MAKEKILIVDDEPMIRYTLNEALRGWEYDTVEVGTVTGALASFETERPAAVLLGLKKLEGTAAGAIG
jgi:CheY-like chemotaxis protein